MKNNRYNPSDKTDDRGEELENINGKELYEQKKREKEALKNQERQKEKMSRAPKKIGKYLFYIIIAGVIIGGLGWFITTRPSLPPTSSANHSERSPLSHIVTQPIPEVIQRHMLEHADGNDENGSGIIIQYNCDDYQCESGLIEKLAEIVEGYPNNVYLAPNNYDGKIILTKLGKRLVLEEFSEDKIIDFIE